MREKPAFSRRSDASRGASTARRAAEPPARSSLTTRTFKRAPKRQRLLDRVRWYAKAVFGGLPDLRSLPKRLPSRRALRARLAGLRSRLAARMKGLRARLAGLRARLAGRSLAVPKRSWVVAACVLVGLTLVVNCRTSPDTQQAIAATQSTGQSEPSLIAGAYFSPQTGASELADSDQDPSASAPSVADLHTKLNQELALVFRDQQLQVISADGQVHWRLNHSAEVLRCAHDPRTDTLWWTTPSEADATTASLHVLDLRSPAKPYTVTAQLPITATWGLAHGDETPLLPLPNQFQVAAVVRLSAEPSVEALLGCDGDMAWFCYEGEPSQRDALTFDVQSAFDRARALKPERAALLARFAARAEDAPSVAEPEVLSKLAEVPTEACLDWPEDCGNAQPLPNTAYWVVTVGNARGDLLHTFSALYDPQSKEFFDLESGTRRPTPPEGRELWLMVSPRGEHVLTDDALRSLQGGLGVGVEAACGWLGGGAAFGGR